MGLLGEGLGMLGKGLKKAVNVAEDFLPWTEEVTYIDEATNGVIKLAKYPDGRVSVIELEVPKEFRGKGVGKKLQAQAMSDNPNLSGQVSSKKAATSAYNLGRRPIDNPNATLDDVYAAIDDMSSVNMATPDAINAFNSVESPAGLLDMSTAARMKRADDMGFGDTTYYHGTSNADIDAFNTDRVFVSKSPKVAENEGGFLDSSFNDIIGTDEVRASNEKFGTSVYPVRLRGKIADREEVRNVVNELGVGSHNDSRVIDYLKSEGFDGMAPSGYETIAFDSSNVRSVNAKFDPAKADSSSLLASNPVATAAAGAGGILAMTASDDSEAGGVRKATGGILDELISSFNSFQAAGETVPDSLMADMASEYAKVKPKTYMEGILAQGEQANLSADALSQGYKPDVFHHVGSPDMQTYDINANRVSGGSTPAGLYTHNRMRDSKPYEDIATENGRSWERYSVVSSTDKPFVVGETKPNDALKGNFIKQMELKFGDKYSNLPDHKKGYWDEKIDKFMQYGNTTASPLTPVQQRQVYLDSGYDSLLLNGNEMVFLDTGKVRDLRADFNKADVGQEGLFKSSPVATASAGILANTMGQESSGLAAIQQGRDALLTPQESQYMKAQRDLQQLLGAKDSEAFNYGELAPVKRNKETGDYSFAMTGLLRDIIEAGHDSLIQPQRTGITNQKSLWDIIL